jgi:hypothetical protein
MEGCEESGALDGGADGGQQQGAVVSRGGQPSRVTLAALLAKEAKGFTRGSGGGGGGGGPALRPQRRATRSSFAWKGRQRGDRI